MLSKRVDVLTHQLTHWLMMMTSASYEGLGCIHWIPLCACESAWTPVVAKLLYSLQFHFNLSSYKL